MSEPIKITFSIENKELLVPLSHISHRYSQASFKNGILRYFTSGVTLKNNNAPLGHIELCFSTKINIESPHVHKSSRKTYIPFLAKIETIEFANKDYTRFTEKIGVELITSTSCEINIKTGHAVLLGEIDSELSMSTFEIGYPIGQPELVRL